MIRLGKLGRDTRGVALLEFAFALPVLALLGMGGLELSQFAMAHHRISQAANSLADNMSRVGLDTGLSVTQLRENDINDGFIGALKQSGSSKLGERGRIILTSLEQNPDDGQWLHWQRCVGLLVHPSSYGNAGDGAAGTAITGMGPAGSQVTAPPDTSVMFVEIAYQYQPIFTDLILPSTKIKARAAYIVRSERDLSGVFNPDGKTSYTCDRHTAS